MEAFARHCPVPVEARCNWWRGARSAFEDLGARSESKTRELREDCGDILRILSFFHPSGIMDPKGFGGF